jgi:hypothetical protein
MMYKGGRPKDPIWEHFESVWIDGKQLAKCRKCGNTQGCKPYRLRDHYKKCSKEIIPVEKNDNDTETVTADIDIEPHASNKRPRDESPPPVKKRIVQKQVADQVVTTSVGLKQTLDKEIAKLFYVGNIPFKLADHDQYKKVMN